MVRHWVGLRLLPDDKDWIAWQRQDKIEIDWVEKPGTYLFVFSVDKILGNLPEIRQWRKKHFRNILDKVKYGLPHRFTLRLSWATCENEERDIQGIKCLPRFISDCFASSPRTPARSCMANRIFSSESSVLDLSMAASKSQWTRHINAGKGWPWTIYFAFW